MGASLPLKITLGLVMLASAIELALISATVAYLAKLSKTTLTVFSSASQTVRLPGLPTTLWVDQGHTANGAAGTGLIIIGCGGILALWLRGRRGYYTTSAFSRVFYRAWLALNVPALLLTLGALAYVFAVTDMHSGHSIRLSAVQEGQDGTLTYPANEWTPQGWLTALSLLNYVDGSERNAIAVHDKIAKGWQFNLIPFFLVQLAQTVFAFLEARRRRSAELGVYVEANLDKGAGFVAK